MMRWWLVLVLLIGANCSDLATQRGASVESRKRLDLKTSEDYDKWMEKLNQALELRGESIEKAKEALERVGFDEAFPADIRGAALTELAIAHENLYPSFATTPEEFRNDPRRDRSGLYIHTFVNNPILNRTRAVELYELAADLGNETAQFRMGTLYATGALGVPQDQVKMLLHYYFASLGGHEGAQMAMGFRHSIGLGVPQDCKSAVLYYELAANKAVDRIEAEGVGPLNERDRISLDRKNRGYSGRGSSRNEDEEVVDYYKHAAEKGDVSALVALGQIYFYGARGVVRDHRLAFNYFRSAAASGDPIAQANLGNMLVKGLGIDEKDYQGAWKNFSSAKEAGSASAMNGLGYMYLYGLGVKQDSNEARKFFNDATEQGNAEAYYNLGALYVSGVGVRRRNYPVALKYFSMAVQKGHTIAMHKLAQMNLHGIGTLKNCDNALHLFKAVAERGESVRLLSRAFSFWANDDDADSALQIYLVASELGFEVAQSNAAWLLDNGADIRGGVPLKGNDDEKIEEESPTENDEGQEDEDATGDLFLTVANVVQDFMDEWLEGLGKVTGSLDALRLYELAAEQGNVDARLKIGDFYYYGLGGMKEPNYELAAHHYKQANDQKNAQAMFNLGYMHQYGIGLPRDFPLAKRYYDSAGLAHHDAKVPVSLALTGLWVHRIYRAIFHKESASDLPSFVTTVAYWMDAFTGGGSTSTTTSSASKEESKAGSVSDSMNEAKQQPSPGESHGHHETTPMIFEDLLDYASELEDDTIVAICLFILLVIVLLIRQREQRRMYYGEQPQQREEEHPHQD